MAVIQPKSLLLCTPGVREVGLALLPSDSKALKMVKAHLLPEDSWEAAVTTRGNSLFKQGSREACINGVRHLHAVQACI